MTSSASDGSDQIETDFHFHEWAFLARTDSEAFERRRRMAIDEFLDQSPRQKKLGVSLQREIDAERKRADDPNLAFVTIAKMMCAQFAFLCEEMNSLSEDVKAIQPRCHGLLSVATHLQR